MLKNAKVDSNRLKTVFGEGALLYFKEGCYYHHYYGGLMEFDFYRKYDNKLYAKYRGNDTLYWTDCGKLGSRIKGFSFSKGKETLLGVNCDELIIQYNDRVETHYYNAEFLLTNPIWFKQFTLNGENIIDEKERSIYLKGKSDYRDFLFIETAVQLHKVAVDSQLFEVPHHFILREQQ